MSAGEAPQDGARVVLQEVAPRLCASHGSWLSRSPHRRCLYFLIMTYFLNTRGLRKEALLTRLPPLSREAGWCLAWGLPRGDCAPTRGPAERGGPGVPCVHVREEPPRGPCSVRGRRRTGPSRAPSVSQGPGLHNSWKRRGGARGLAPVRDHLLHGHSECRIGAPVPALAAQTQMLRLRFSALTAEPEAEPSERRGPGEDAGAVAQPRPSPPRRDSPVRPTPRRCWEARAALSSKAVAAGGQFVPRFSLSCVCSVQTPPTPFKNILFI